MARTNSSIYREAELTSQIPQEQGRLRRARGEVSVALAASTAAVGDALSRGAISRAYNEHVLSHYPLEVHIPTGNITASRLAVAGLYAAVGIVASVRAGRAQGRIDHLEASAQGEAQSDRLATAVELGSGQRPIEAVIPDPGEFLPVATVDDVTSQHELTQTASVAPHMQLEAADPMHPGYGS